MDFFEFFSGLAVLYALWAMFTGEIVAKSGAGWVRYRRVDHPVRFWGAVGALLALGVFTFFVLPQLRAN